MLVELVGKKKSIWKTLVFGELDRKVRSINTKVPTIPFHAAIQTSFFKVGDCISYQYFAHIF